MNAAAAKTSARLAKLLAIAASCHAIGSDEARAALARAEAIALDHDMNLAPLAAAAGTRCTSSDVVTSRNGYILARTVSVLGDVELCTLNRDGRTEVYIDVEKCGRRDWIGYADEITDAAVLARIAGLIRLHERTRAAFWR